MGKHLAAAVRLLIAPLLLGVGAGGVHAQCQYEVTTIVEVPGCGLFPWANNAEGFFTGSFRCGLGQSHAFGWFGGFLSLPSPAGTTMSEAHGMNDDRIIVGCLEITDDGFGDLAFVFDSLGTRTLGVLPDHFRSEANAVSADGVIVGFSASPVRATAWIDEEIVDLTPLLLDMPTAKASDVNERDQIVGWRAVDGFSPQRAFLLNLETEEVVDIGFMPGGTDGKAEALNNRGQVVAFGRHTESGETRSFLWSSGTKTDLGVLPGMTRTRVDDINERGLVVGFCDVNGGSAAFLWQDGAIHDLNFLAPNEEVTLVSASSITDDGQILCLAETIPDRDTVAVLLTPVSPPAGDASGDCVVDFRDLLLVLAEWGKCQFCIADFDGDGAVGMADLLLMLTNWG